MALLATILALLQGTIPEEGFYWVMFSDRGENLQARLEEASSRIAESTSAERRAAAGKLQADVFDLQPWAPYVEAVELSVSEPARVESRYLNAVSIKLTPEQAADLQNRPFVREVRPLGVSTFQPEEGIPAPGSYGLSLSQLQQINTFELQQRGWNGSGVTIGILDSGFEIDHPCLQSADVLGQYDFINQDSVVAWQPGDPPSQASHGTRVLSMIAGFEPGVFIGGAFGASFLLAKTEDTGNEYQQEEDFWVAGLEWLELQGADLVNSSLGYSDWYEPWQLDGNTAVTTIAADLAASRGLLVYNSAGNSGPGESTLIAPADGDSVFAAGAVDGTGILADFSSRGPTADGRIKPDGCARGSNAVSASYGGTGYSTVNGTSFASPLIASAAACISSAHPEWSMMRIYEALQATAHMAHNPDNQFGYGIINGLAAVMHRSVAGKVRRSDNGEPISGIQVNIVMDSGTEATATTNEAGCFAVEPGELSGFTASTSGWGVSIPVQGILHEEGADVILYVDPVGSSLPPSAYPNPSAGGFYIGFDLTDEASDVSLTVFTVTGEEVFHENRTVVEPGCYRAPLPGEAFHWNGTNWNGEEVSSGHYIALLKIADETELMKLAVVRGME